MMGLGDLPGGGFRSDAFGVSTDGSVVVGSATSVLGIQAYRWTAETGMVALGDLPGGLFDSRARAISADGTVVVGESSSSLGAQAFRWTHESGMVGLGFLSSAGSQFSQAEAVSRDGSVVVGISEEAFIWDHVNGMRSLKQVLINDFGLDMTGWLLERALERATGISSDGLVIVGIGSNPNFNASGWVVKLVCMTDANCNDGIPCTVDSCDSVSHTCKHATDDSVCSDGVFCNGTEVCDSTVGCQSGSPQCNDDISCTVDGCDEVAQECSNVMQDTMCDDGVFCNGAERCHPTLGCLGSSPPDCDDDNDCTDDSCDLDGDGCAHVELTDGTACEDGFVCTLNDSCLDAVCVSGGINPLCVGSAGPPGGSGSQGTPGTGGISCWDLDGDGVADPDEDVNDDGDFNALDCIGPKGPQGPAGVSCWDINGNGIGEPAEDINGDGNFDAFDCQGLAGRSCEEDDDCQDGRLSRRSFLQRRRAVR